MCVGIPMQVVATGPGYAWCVRAGRRERVSTLLIDQPAENAWVLVFLGSAREILDPERAAQIDEALQALEAVATGGSLDGFFADLTDREPQLPDFLRPDRTPR